MNRVSVVVISLVAAVIGGVVGTRLERQREGDDERLRAGLGAVKTAGLCADSLRALDEGRAETQRLILETQMAMAVEEADQDLGRAGDAKIGLSIPNLIEGVRRARQYAESRGNRDLVAKCDRVLATLLRGRRA